MAVWYHEIYQDFIIFNHYILSVSLWVCESEHVCVCVWASMFCKWVCICVYVWLSLQIQHFLFVFSWPLCCFVPRPVLTVPDRIISPPLAVCCLHIICYEIHFYINHLLFFCFEPAQSKSKCCIPDLWWKVCTWTAQNLHYLILNGSARCFN